ncbi:MAG: 4,5-DOPA dioxygenase extradiol [Fluviicoccus sp.]|uniref:4,5-DOPA-extradiol-dioxygenase n=1 Tax=Fluviicoccus sp. TaxID=2003552 RepID=UPI0027196D7F|nr:4,5-DOPA dioxygenase extradiol [Fluviicoccus sp.]MDO8330166.1 4,5-DOPA dioxygenase extradiol [Fluviicoccus sp.]
MSAPTPALFIGHGSPENAIRDNPFTQSLQALGKRITRPKAALVISAHWLTRGITFTASPHPEQVFDFSGFPQALHQVHYRPYTSPALIQRLQQMNLPALADPAQGFDHGVWTVLKHLWPDADVPLVQLSLDITRDRLGHLALGARLQALRAEGYMIIASGNIVHNLRELDWSQPSGGQDWAKRYDLVIKQALESKDNTLLLQPRAEQNQDSRLSVPTEDHYWPLLYVAGTRMPTDQLEWVYEGYEYGGISLRSFMLH